MLMLLLLLLLLLLPFLPVRLLAPRLRTAVEEWVQLPCLRR